jgi:hypothetical protein
MHTTPIRLDVLHADFSSDNIGIVRYLRVLHVSSHTDQFLNKSWTSEGHHACQGYQPPLISPATTASPSPDSPCMEAITIDNILQTAIDESEHD